MAILNSGKASIKNDLAELFDTVQEQRLQFIGDLREINLTARGLFELEAARLSRKLGAENPRAQAMAARVENRLELLEALEVEAQIAQVRAPVVDNASALVHGRIVDAGLKGVAGAEVRLVNEKGEDLGAAPIKTDEAGYYAIEIKSEVAAKIGPEQKVFLSVAGEKGKLTPAAEEGFTVKAGDKTLKEAVLNATEVENLRGKLDLGVVLARGVVTPAASAAPVDMVVAPKRSEAPEPKPAAKRTKPGAKKPGK
ncbi:MAG TPA: hypothetical protein VF104_00605 [Burkholderiales bacterium]